MTIKTSLRETMHWILTQAYEWSTDYKCSRCGYEINITDDSRYALTKYDCPHCKRKQKEV